MSTWHVLTPDSTSPSSHCLTLYVLIQPITGRTETTAFFWHDLHRSCFNRTNTRKTKEQFVWFSLLLILQKGKKKNESRDAAAADCHLGVDWAQEHLGQVFLNMLHERFVFPLDFLMVFIEAVFRVHRSGNQRTVFSKSPSLQWTFLKSPTPAKRKRSLEETLESEIWHQSHHDALFVCALFNN